MNLTKTGKKTEGGVVLEFSPKYSTAESYTSWETKQNLQLHVRRAYVQRGHRRALTNADLGGRSVGGERVKQRGVPAEEVLQHGAVSFHRGLPPGDLHAALQSAHVLQDAVQGDYQRRREVEVHFHSSSLDAHTYIRTSPPPPMLTLRRLLQEVQLAEEAADLRVFLLHDAHDEVEQRLLPVRRLYVQKLSEGHKHKRRRGDVCPQGVRVSNS